jgi:hypothetical protein
VYQRKWSEFGAIMALIVVGSLFGCSDNDSTAPQFERPDGNIVGLDRTKRRATRELGGSQALQAMSEKIGSAPLSPGDPLEQMVAEWRAKQGVASGSSAVKMWQGVEQYDGDYYVWSGGESYAPLGKQAKIYSFTGRATRLGDGPVDVDVAFKFDGHRASNEAQWTLTSSSGQQLRSRPFGNFGSQTDPFFGLTAFGARGWAATASEEDVGCDVRVTGSTRARAWYGGTWNQNGVGVGVNPSGVSIQINYSQQDAGQVETSKSLGTTFTCPPSNEGGYDGLHCYVCQQWFSFDGYAVFEWWECGPVDMADCWAT